MARYTLRQLEYFVAVGETGSIARASEKINVSSPSISAAISQLEQEFLVPLFVRRHAQGVSLTPGGKRLLDQARQVLKAANGLADIAAEISGAVRGPLSVGCLVTFAQLVLPLIRRGFQNAHPDVRILQHEMNQTELFSALRRSDIDVAMTYDMDIPTDLQFTGLIHLKPYAVVDAQHPLADKKEVDLQELAELPMVLLDLPISSDYFLSLFQSAGRQPRIAERTRDMAVMRSMVGNGFGYSIANVLSPVELSPDGNPLRYVPLAGDARALRMGLLTAHEADRSSVVRAFIQYGKERAAAGQFAAIGGKLAQ